MHTRGKDLASWLAESVAAAGRRGLTVSLAPTVDALVVARLCHLAMPGSVVGVAFGSRGDASDVTAMAGQLGIPLVQVDLAETTSQTSRQLAAAMAAAPPSPRSASDDDADGSAPIHRLESRARMAATYFVAERLEHLVAGTANRSALTIGRVTKYGDASGDVLPLGDLLQSEVLALAADLDLPRELTSRTAADAGAEREAIGFSYADLERYLAEGPEAVAPATALRIERRMRQSARLGIPTPGDTAPFADG